MLIFKVASHAMNFQTSYPAN